MDFDFSVEAYQPHQFVRQARIYAQQSQYEVPPHILTSYLFDAVDALSYQLYTREQRGTARYDDIAAARHVLYKAKCAIDRYLGTDEVGKRMAQYYQDLQQRQQVLASECEQSYVNGILEAAPVQPQPPQLAEPTQPAQPELEVAETAEAPEISFKEQNSDQESAAEVVVPADSVYCAVEEDVTEIVAELQQQAEMSNQKSMECLQSGAQKEGLEHLIRRNQALIRIAEVNIGRGVDVDVNEKRIIQLQEFVGHVEAALSKM